MVIDMMYPRRQGLKQLKVNEAVEIKVGQVGLNKFGKKQISGFIGEEYFFLPTHQELVEKLLRCNEGEVVKVKRLSLGNAKETAKYEVIRKEGSPEPSTPSETSEPSEAEKVLSTVISCLKNNASAGVTIQVLEQEFGKETLKDLGL